MSTNGLGFIGAVLMLVIMAIWTSPDHPLRYLDAHGGFTVFIGTFLVAVISVPAKELKFFIPMVRVVARKVKDDSIEIVDQIVKMADAARVDMQSVAAFKDQTNDPFLKDAIGLLTAGYELDTIETVLRRRIEVQKEREGIQAKMFKNLGKYPPACGLMGTVFGMIALLASLGQEGAGEKIGPAMSVALAATLYGVIAANLLIMPVADNLGFRSQTSIAKRQMIMEGILLVKKRTPGLIVREILISHIAPGARGKVGEVEAGAGNGAVSNAAA